MLKNTEKNRNRRPGYLKIAVVDVHDNLFYRRPIGYGAKFYVKYNQTLYRVRFDRAQGVYYLSNPVDRVGD